MRLVILYALSAAEILLYKQYQVGLLPGTVVNRTYGALKNLYIHLVFLKIVGPIYYGPP